MKYLLKKTKNIFAKIPLLSYCYGVLSAYKTLGYKAVRFNLKHYGNHFGFKGPFALPMSEVITQEKETHESSTKFSIVIFSSDSNCRYGKETVISIKGQSYSNHKTYNNTVDLTCSDYFIFVKSGDILAVDALYVLHKKIVETSADFLYFDEAEYTTQNPIYADKTLFKPDFSPDTLRSENYIGNAICVHKSLLENFNDILISDSGFDFYDFVLKLSEMSKKIEHVKKPLYFYRLKTQYSYDKRKKAVYNHLKRIGRCGDISDIEDCVGAQKVTYSIQNQPLVSIIIPSCNERDTLNKCVESILTVSSYSCFELIIVENGSSEPKTFELYKKLVLQDSRIKILNWDEGFNYSKINNFAVKEASGKHILFLNNDTEVISKNWIEEMLMFSHREDVGVVGAKLYYPDDTVQHAGVVFGAGGIAGHNQIGSKRSENGYMNTLSIARNVSAVTGACMMVKKALFESVGGFNEDLAVAFNDVDLCQRILKKGYLNIFTPFAELYHYESKSRGEENTPEKKKRFNSEIQLMKNLWQDDLSNYDPYYNKNLSYTNSDVFLDIKF